MVGYSARTSLPLGAAGVALAAVALQCGSFAADFATTEGVGGGGMHAGGNGGDAGGCAYGAITCVGTIAYTCDAMGNVVDGVDCLRSASGDTTCVDRLGCVACVPGTTACANDVGTYCTDDGRSTVSFACDAAQGMRCTPAGCTGACTPDKLGETHVGCEFWPTVTANSAWSDWFSFGVLVTNTTQLPATLAIDYGDIADQRIVAPGGVMTVELPWVKDLKGADADASGTVQPPEASIWSRAVEGGGAYRLRSNQPVTVVQLNTLHASNPDGLAGGCPADKETGACLSYSNDASLLVPTRSLGTAYLVTGWHAWVVAKPQANPVAMGDLLSITAPFAATKVSITPSSPTLGIGGLEPFEPGATTEVLLEQGDVLQLFTDGTAASHQWAGATVTADRPVQLISGSPCATIPAGAHACDHLEEWVPPVSKFGKRYLATAPLSPDGRLRHVLRLHGVTDGTVVSFDPPVMHKAVPLNRGESVEIDVTPQLADNGITADVLLYAQEVFGLTQYLPSGGSDPGSPQGVEAGDPSQSLVVPVSRYLKSYVLAIPDGFDSSRVNVVASTGSQVTLNGEPIPSSHFTAIGASGLSVARLEGLEPGRRHELQGEQPIGAVVYGYGAFTSFMFPAGMDLRTSAPTK